MRVCGLLVAMTMSMLSNDVLQRPSKRVLRGMVEPRYTLPAPGTKAYAFLATADRTRVARASRTGAQRYVWQKTTKFWYGDAKLPLSERAMKEGMTRVYHKVAAPLCASTSE